MTFPVESTSVITVACHRFAERVMQRSAVRNLISRGEVYNPKQVTGSECWSEHAWGNAVDLMADEHDLERIAFNALRQAQKRTLANRGVRVPIHTIIYDDKVWDTENPTWHHYGGTRHTTHVHVDFLPGHSCRKPPWVPV